MKMFKKEDIKAGYLLEFQNGKLAIVTYNDRDELCYSSENKWGNIEDLTGELKQFEDGPRVVAIYGRTYNACAYALKKQGRMLLWKCEEPKTKMTLTQIEALLGKSIEIVEE